MASRLKPPPIVLVVEDEPVTRFRAMDIVEEAGFEAFEASSADEAMAVLTERPDIRVVFTDIDMPGSMDGAMLAVVIRRRWPEVELILTSGYIKVRDEDIPSRGRFFAKPYRAEDIQHALHDLIG